jgi:predicted Rossmann-fold nucleotide-binding protein
VVRAADALVAVGGGWGTLSEIALALRDGKPVVGLDTWELGRNGRAVEGVVPVTSADEAVELALALAVGTPDAPT